MLDMPPEEPGNDWEWFKSFLWGLLELIGILALMLFIAEKIGE